MMRLGNLTKNSIYNLLGNGLPFLIGVVTIPRLISVLGVERFGILTLNWAVLGYFGLFDLGLGRALTQIVAERSETEGSQELPNIIRTALAMMLMLGVAGGLLLAIVSPLLTSKALKMAAALKEEVFLSLLLTASCVPSVTLLAGVRGILEGRQRFFENSLLRLGMGILTFLGPWVVSFWTVHLFWVVFSLFLMRYLALYAHYWVCTWAIPEFSMGGRVQRIHIKTLAKFGGWMTVSNIISPLMVNFDRFFIGAFLSVSAVTYYATPFEMVTKLLIIAGAIVAVLFPAFGSLYRTAPREALRLYYNGLKTIFYILLPLLLLLGAGAPRILTLWLGPTFPRQGAQVMQVLCLGVLLNSLAAVPFAFIQGMARPDLTAKCHLLEIPIYILVLWGLGTHFGIVGVAWAWTIRVSIDFILLMRITRNLQQTLLPTGPEEIGAGGRRK